MSSPTLELKNEIIRAGAGAGKTTALISKVIDTARLFKKTNGRFPHMIVTTFTRKATQELRERLLEKACQLEDKELLRFVSSNSLLHISSIHGVLNMFLIKCGFMGGIDPGFNLVDEGEFSKDARSVLRKIILNEEKYQDLLERYDFTRLLNVLNTLNSTKILLPNLVSCNEVHLEKTANIFLDDLLNRFNSVCEAILVESENQKWIDFSNNFQELKQSLVPLNYKQRHEKIITWLEPITKPRYSKKTVPVSEETSENLSAIWKEFKKLSSSKAEDSFLDPKLWTQFVEEVKLIEEVSQLYSEKIEQQKLQSGKIVLSDLEEMSLKLIRSTPVAAEVFSEQWDYWLIDEFQDTSPIQVELLESLIGKKNYFIVGDPQQSIYLFRGARSEVFVEKENEIHDSGGIKGLLQKNYRSQPELLLFFNDFFTKLGGQFLEMKPREKKPEEISNSNGKDQVAKFIITNGKDSPDGQGNDENLIKAISEQLHDLLVNKKCSPDQISILARTNKDLEKIASELIKLNYPVHVNASSRFYDRREIIDAASILKFLINPYDNLNFLTLVRSPWFKIEDNVLANLKKEAVISNRKDVAYWELLESLEHPIVGELKLCLEKAKQEGVILVFKSLLVSAGVFTWCKYIDAAGRREANLWKYLNQLIEAEKEPGFNLIEFINKGVNIDVLQSSSEADATAVIEPDRINLMTVHASKGLQFDHVIIPNLDRSPMLSKATECSIDKENQVWTLPIFSEEHSQWVQSIVAIDIRNKERQKELLEQERLLYVALTRAKRSVLLHWDEEIKKNSLASNISWDTTKDFIETEKYSYTVERSGWEYKRYAEKTSNISTVRKPFFEKDHLLEKMNTTIKKETISVSQLLNNLVISNQSDVVETANILGVGQENQSSNNLIEKFKKTSEGTLLHKAFEALKYSTKEDVLDKFSDYFSSDNIGGRSGEKSGKKRGKKSGESTLVNSLDYICEIEHPPLLKIIKNGFVEDGFICVFDKVKIEGQIDLWGIVNGTMWVIDYKTGNPNFFERAFKQLAIYAEALRKKHRNIDQEASTEIKLAIVYPTHGKVEVSDIKDWSEFTKNCLGIN